ncbi:hypothetical protein BHAOGJBA_4233 [Methylobacterium hispanicum]|uniref:Uncharacterized protein n=1 Tax=Methylobacterium hispanicum TaxID=270350 RepID=A0AAV4ZRJ3_9HYPH|nr:hypothetical protein [Methylobacterium hispanicum]GJD90691.1 hypothetical protein BHAOGJBA_4233 [Methylobacterium hispanicum]
MNAAHFTLSPDGTFAVRRSRALVRISRQPRGPFRWNLTIVDEASDARILDVDHHSLDHAFKDAAAAMEIGTGGWRSLMKVEVGAEVFHRPGSVPAETILDRLGCVLVDSLQIFVLDTFADCVDAATVRRIFADRLDAVGAEVGAVNRIGTPPGEAIWCVDAVLPVSGCFHRDRLSEAAGEIVASCDAGTLVSCIPHAVSRSRVEADPAAVVRFARAG